MPNEEAAGPPGRRESVRACLVWRRRKRKAPADDNDNDDGGDNKDAAPNDDDDDDDKQAREQTFPSPSFRHAIRTFLSSGCAIVPSVLPKAEVDYCYKVAQSDLKFLTDTVGEVKRHAIATSDANLLAASVNVDFREILDRDGGRRDVRFYLGSDSPYKCEGIVYNPIVYPLVRELLGGGDVNLLYAGIMWGMRDQDSGDHQKWHGDGGHLFDHVHLPPHCINVFYPLIDLPDRNIGPTEVQAGSHILGNFNSSVVEALPSLANEAMLFYLIIVSSTVASQTSCHLPTDPCCISRTPSPIFRTPETLGHQRAFSLLLQRPIRVNTLVSILLRGRQEYSLSVGCEWVVVLSVRIFLMKVSLTGRTLLQGDLMTERPV